MSRAEYYRDYRAKKRAGVPSEGQTEVVSDHAECIVQISDLEAEVRRLKQLLAAKELPPQVMRVSPPPPEDPPTDITGLFDLPPAPDRVVHSFGQSYAAPKPGAKPKPARR